MTESIIVQTGEVKTGGRNDVLKSSPIGSCVAVVLFDAHAKAGGMAHIMLPGKAPEKKNVITTRYAENAINLLIQQLKLNGAKKEKLKAVIVGGGNVLKRPNDLIGQENLDSVNELLQKSDIEVVAGSVAGEERKAVRFDIQAGNIYVATGDEKEKVLCRIDANSILIE